MKLISSTPLLRAILAPAVGILVALVFFAIASLYKQILEEQQRAVQIERVAEIRANIEGAFNGATNLTAGLIAFVSKTGDISESFFSQLSESLIEQNSLIRNITLAPNNIIRYVYPIDGNEAALGLDLLNHPTQGEATQAMISAGQPILAGPYELVQGGVGVIHRVPIFITQDDGQTDYWGLMSTPIDFTALLEASGIFTASDLEIALRSLRGTGADGVVFFGNEEIFEHPDAIRSYVSVLNGEWELIAKPISSHSSETGRLVFFIQLLGGIFAILTTFMIWQLLRMNERLQVSQAQYRQLAQHDSLTGLPNRTLLNDRFEQAVARTERNQEILVLFYMDLDEFKTVNDEHGHQIGDQVLTEVAARYRESIRSSDSVIRMGGDEFVILLEKLNHVDAVLSVCDKLLKSINRPIEIGPHRFTLGMSIGIACFPNDGITLDQLITAADHAMYQAKEAGKNQIGWASNPNDYFRSSF